jgi:hypothetical protein
MAAAALDTCPIDVKGDWGTADADPKAVLQWMRIAAFKGVELRSDRQPAALLVENRNVSNPAIWLHKDPADVAWIIVHVSPRAWCQLAYQFGHELGHVLANSWAVNARPQTPSQWLEEALVEAFALRALGELADDWRRKPPFPGDMRYAEQIVAYRQQYVARYQDLAKKQGADNLRKWFTEENAVLGREQGLGERERAVVPAILGLIEPEPFLIEDYAALNRWEERSSLPLWDYIVKWEKSCRAIGSSGKLPILVRTLLER